MTLEEAELSKVSQYARELPNELREGVKGLDHEVRQAIVVLLMRSPDLSFTEIASALGISKSQLSHHLDILLDSALIRNFSKAELKGPFDSYYALSNFGRRILEALAKVLQPAFESVDWRSINARSNLAASTVMVLGAGSPAISFIGGSTSVEVEPFTIRSKPILLDSATVRVEFVGSNRPLVTGSAEKPMDQVLTLTAKPQKTSALA